MSINRNKKIAALGMGAVLGASLSVLVGGMGLVGRFGGISLKMDKMMGAGAIVGAATLGMLEARKTKDAKALGAMSLGALGGAGVSSTVGNMGLAFGSTAVAIGMMPVVVAGGLVGLGIYGLRKEPEVDNRESEERIQKSSSADNSAIQAFARIEESITEREMHLQAISEVDSLLSEMRWEQKMKDLEIAENLQVRQQQIEG